MKYRRLGRSGLEVSMLTLGTMTFGDLTDETAAREIVAHAREAGVNFIDTADVYVTGESERIVGQAIHADRDHWVLATKVGNRMVRDERNNGGLSRAWIVRACDGSLGRLGTDRIDVYYLHRDDLRTPLDETIGALGDLIRSGKIRYFGVSNFRGWRIAEVMRTCERLGVPPPIVCQPYYNLLNRMPEVEVLPACDHYGIGVAPYSPIARGVLTGKYAPGSAPPADSRGARKDQRMMETEFREESFAIAQALKEHAATIGTHADAVRARVAVGEPDRVERDRRPAHARAVEGLRGRDRHRVVAGGRGAGRHARPPRPSVHPRLHRPAVSVLRAEAARQLTRRGVRLRT